MGVLSDAKCRSAKAGKHADGSGLALVVRDTGARLWWFRYRFSGKEKTFSLGRYPEISLADARLRTFELRRQLAMGVDPMALKLAEKDAERDRHVVVTFGMMLGEMLEGKAKRVSATYLENYRRSMELHVLPVFGGRDINAISAPDVIRLATGLESAGKYLPHNILKRMGEVFGYAVATGRASVNPVSRATHYQVKPHSSESHSAIRMDELPEFMRDLAEYRGFPITKLLIRFLLHTAVRTGEARDARWSWIDLDAGLMTIPPDQHKTGRKAVNAGCAHRAVEHLVPLSTQAVDLLVRAREITGGAPDQYVFPMFRDHSKKASENVVTSAIRSMGDREKWKGRQSGHGFRRLARTEWGNSGKWSFDVMERQLAHSVGGSTARAYDKSVQIDSRRKMLQWWSDQISSICPD